MGIPTSVVVMHTRTTLKHLFIFSIVGCGLIKAQESGDGNDESVDFMSDDGKDDFNAGRFEDGDKGLGDYYSDYGSDTDVVDMLEDYDDSDKSVEEDGYTYYETYGSGEDSDEDMERRLEALEALDPNDEEEADQELYYSDSHPGSIFSALGVEDNAGHFSRGVTEPGPATFVNIMDYELDLMRKVRKRKKKRRKNKKQQNNENTYHAGALTAFNKNDTFTRGTNHAPGNCERGWTADNMMCANQCRMEFLKAGGADAKADNPYAFYASSPQYTRCEACAVWAWYVKGPDVLQKILGNLRKGPPSFCKKE